MPSLVKALRATPAKGWNAGNWFVSGRDLVGSLSATGETITHDKALRYSAYFAAVSYIAQDIAKLPLHVYRDLPPREGGLSGGKEKATYHWAYPLLHRRPHPRMTSFLWRETLIGHLLGWGNAYCAIARDGTGQVRELMPLRPDRMTVLNDGSYEYEHSVSGRIALEWDDVFHVRGFGFDGQRGYSLLSLMSDAIALGRGHEGFGTSFYKNGARPSVIATHKGNLSDEAAERIQKRIVDNHTGSGKQWGVLVLEEDLAISEIGVSAKDAQFLEGREFQVEELARFIRMPPHKLMSQKPGAVAYASVEERNIDYVVDTLQSQTTRLEQEIDLQLLPDDIYSKLDLRGLLKGNTEKRWLSYGTGLDKRVLTPNEVRDLEDYNPVPWGDEPLSTPNNNAPSPEDDEPDPTKELLVAIAAGLGQLAAREPVQPIVNVTTPDVKPQFFDEGAVKVEQQPEIVVPAPVVNVAPPDLRPLVSKVSEMSSKLDDLNAPRYRELVRDEKGKPIGVRETREKKK
jgi:HK97 family phage portal protein